MSLFYFYRYFFKPQKDQFQKLVAAEDAWSKEQEERRIEIMQRKLKLMEDSKALKQKVTVE